jgi:hypothetical protein
MRRDGWFEHKATWAEVGIGDIIGQRDSRTAGWEIVDVSQATQVQYGYTLWMRARSILDPSREVTIQPRLKVDPVVLLTRDPADTKSEGPSAPSDADAIMELVNQLGAHLLATRDLATGEIVCPDYIDRTHVPDGPQRVSRGLIEHLRVAHGQPVDDGTDLVSLSNLHGQSQDPRWPNIGKGGFPHRHVPEDPALY